ncbi:MAG TPA: recombinase family protein, partial [Symbiobacteriaceae bacterium]|nr:recombinase family protein [Symbiobacteriaceae bacterium]
MQVDPDRVAIYIRWSTEDQAEGTTLEVQREACTHYVLSQGWRVSHDLIFIDDGCSGGTLDRPALARLRHLVKEGRIQAVVVYRLDRLSRSVVDTVNLVLQEWDGLCHVKSAREPIDTASQAGRMFFYTLVSYAEWERAAIRERTSAGRLRRAAEGRWAAGRPPFGYQLDAEHRLALHPEEAPVVARIFREYLAGKGSPAIAFELAREGAPFRGRIWWAGAVKRVLENPVYCGELRYGITRANPRHGKR